MSDVLSSFFASVEQPICDAILIAADYIINVHPDIFISMVAILSFYVIGFIRQMKLSYQWGLVFRFGLFYNFWLGVCGVLLALSGKLKDKNNDGYPPIH